MTPSEKILMASADAIALWGAAEEAIAKIKIVLDAEKLSFPSREALMLAYLSLTNKKPQNAINLEFEYRNTAKSRAAQYTRTYRARKKQEEVKQEQIMQQAAMETGAKARNIEHRMKWVKAGGDIEVFERHESAISTQLMCGANVVKLIREYTADIGELL